jgi:hypothetical protein
MLIWNRNRVVWVVAVAALASTACMVTGSSAPGGGSGGSGGSSSSPIGVGPIAHKASEAFPGKPASLPAISASDIAKSCALYTACTAPSNQSTQADLLFGEGFCINDVNFSAERAIPISDLESDNERAEYFVQCVTAHAGDCQAIGACVTTRSSDIYCEEDGCRGRSAATVTCRGTVATVHAGGDTFTRDCALAYAKCDPSSSTGCTDRPFTRCPPGGNTADHCDGNVRLGCDSAGQVSYHDCARMGGTCGTLSNGGQGCIYGGGVTDPQCASGDSMPTCSGATLSACVNGQLVSIDAPEVCTP